MNPSPEQIARELAPHGTLRAAINLGNPVLVQREPDGSPRGITVDLARRLGEALGLAVELVTFDGAGKVFAAAPEDRWDVAFLAIDPVRAEEMAFTAPYVVIEGTYLVKRDAPFASIEEVDRPGVRIAASRNAAYDLYLKRHLKHAALVYTEESDGVVKLMLEQGLDAAAGIRQPLVEAAESQPGLRVIDGRFMAIEQAMGTPRTRSELAQRYLAEFVESAKATGFVAEALRRHGQHGVNVAPPAAN